MIQRLLGFLLVSAGALILSGLSATADDFEIFDGHVYNGRYYPRIDIIEWSDNPGDLSHMEFHVFWKNKPLDMSFLLETGQNKKVMLVNYDIKDRGEHLCRRVLAPGHFTEGYLVYRDTSDPDFDNIIVTMDKLPAKKGRELMNPKKYLACSAPSAERLPANNDSGTPAAPDDQKRTVPDKGALKKKGQGVPFSDW